MLLFITKLKSYSTTEQSFNTSHVTLYHIGFITVIKERKVSIHLMLLFIDSAVLIPTIVIPFQYISCYSLSAFLLLFCHNISTFQYISCYSLSASGTAKFFGQIMFQYISCYSLSLILFASFQQISKFQYISCYSLSMPVQHQLPDIVSVSIHLMLLFISHQCHIVTLSYLVSIHLMLLFISKTQILESCNVGFNTSHVTLYQLILGTDNYEILFQYISCYSLSAQQNKSTCNFDVSIHLMLLFICSVSSGSISSTSFQYISCYSLSVS